MRRSNKDWFTLPRGSLAPHPPGDQASWAHPKGEAWVHPPVESVTVGGAVLPQCIVNSAAGTGSETNALKGAWTLCYAGVILGERLRAGVGSLIAPRLYACTLEFTLIDERVREQDLTVVCVYQMCQMAAQSTHPFLSPCEGCYKMLLLGTPLFYWGTSTLIWAMTV